VSRARLTWSVDNLRFSGPCDLVAILLFYFLLFAFVVEHTFILFTCHAL
jgi:hypothetical protein